MEAICTYLFVFFRYMEQNVDGGDYTPKSSTIVDALTLILEI